MKRFLTLVLLLNFVVCGLFGQKKSKNKAQSSLTIELGVPIIVRQDQRFPIPLNIEFQKIKKIWGLGATLGLTYDRYSEGDCNKRFETGTYAKLFSPFSGGITFGDYFPYCRGTQWINFKPAVFGSYYFLQKRKFNLFVKIGVSASVLEIHHTSGEYFSYELQSDTSGRHKVIDGGPIHVSNNRHSWRINNIDLLSGIGMNYILNKRTSIRFAFQSEVNMPFSPYFLNENRGFFISGLCGLSFKI